MAYGRQKVVCEQPFSVPDNYVAVVRKIVREILLEKTQVPTVDEVFSSICALKVSDVESLNLFDEDLPELDEKILYWSRSTLYRFIIRSGFAYNERVSHYEYTKTREYVVVMRDNYLEWIYKYRNKSYQIYYQDETWVFKNMTCKENVENY